MSVQREARERVPNDASEERLLEIRRQAQSRGAILDRGIRPAGAPFPTASLETGYYGIPMLKEPQWKWEVPLYFAVGGASGAAAVIGAVADWLNKDHKLASDARWLAFGGAMASSILLVSDLGRPSRFLNMLRVIKLQSPMSVGAWTLTAFGAASATAAFAKATERPFGSSVPISVIGNFGELFSVVFGLPLHNYTGVLIGATAIPVWNQNIETLPIHFGMSGVQSAVSILELLGHDDSRALNVLGMGSALWESWEGFHLERRTEPALKPLKRGTSGWLVRTGVMLSGPLALTLRLLAGVSRKSRSRSLRRWAAVSGIVGSLLTRYGWMRAGHASARDWRLPLEIPSTSTKQQQRQLLAPATGTRAAS